MVRRVAEEIELDIVELGVDGRLVRLQLEELMGGVEDDRRLVIKDYFHEDTGWHVEEALDALTDLGTEDLLDLKAVGAALHLPHGTTDLDENLQPRGFRLLARIPRLPEPVVERIVARFGNLQKIMRATIDDLDDVSGVGETRARAIKEGLSRLAETSILDRYT
jgi:diadenylate cyclase